MDEFTLANVANRKAIENARRLCREARSFVGTVERACRTDESEYGTEYAEVLDRAHYLVQEAIDQLDLLDSAIVARLLAATGEVRS